MRRLKPADKPPMGTNCFIDNFFSFIFCGRMFCLFCCCCLHWLMYLYFSVSPFFFLVENKNELVLLLLHATNACILSPFQCTLCRCIFIPYSHWLIHSLLFVATFNWFHCSISQYRMITPSMGTLLMCKHVVLRTDMNNLGDNSAAVYVEILNAR